jgi:hypothetical protein
VNGLDPGNISRLERGRLPPPQGDRRAEYAKMLQLVEGSDEWYKFCDLASAEKGMIPEDLQSEEEVMDKLPILFRTLRGQKVPDEKLDELIRMIRRS